jgi:AraC-like DNA-binding protein
MILYQEMHPRPALAPYLACLWTCHVTAVDGGLTHRVLPDNCIDILWQDSDPQGGVAGMMSRAIEVPFARPVRTLAVRFKPGAAARFFDLPLHELLDLHPSLSDLWGSALAGQFADALWSQDLSDIEALDVLQRLLLQRLQTSRLRLGLVEHAVAAIEASNGLLRIETLADRLGVSRQHLASQFRARVGLSAKLFARVCRFQHASAHLKSVDAARFDMAALATELGYYDQPHMIHEFRALSGSTPQSFAAKA